MNLLKRFPAGIWIAASIAWTAAACKTQTDIQPIVIDLSAAKTPSATPTGAPVPTPPPTPTPRPAAPSAPAVVPPSATADHLPAATAPRAAPPGAPSAGSTELSPEAVAALRLEVYNRRDLEALVNLFAPDAKIYSPPDRVRNSGIVAIRAEIARHFAAEGPRTATVAQRMTQGNFVVEREIETDSSGRSQSFVLIWEIRGGKIANVWILR